MRASINELLKALNEVTNDSTSKKNNLIPSINTVRNHITAINRKNFATHAEKLVDFLSTLYQLVPEQIFQDTRFAQSFCQVTKTIEQHLKKIKKMGENETCNSILLQWKQLYVDISNGKNTPLPKSVNKENLDFYYFKYLIKNTLRSSCFNPIPLLEWLSPNHLDLLDHSLITITSNTITLLQDFNKILAFTNYFQKIDEKTPHMVSIFLMDNGRYDIFLKFLIQHPILQEKPGQIHSTIIQMAAIKSDHIVMNLFIGDDGINDIMNFALENGYYRVIDYLLSYHKNITLDAKKLPHCCELSATCGDITFLKKLFSHLKNKDKNQLYEKHVLPYFRKSSKKHLLDNITQGEDNTNFLKMKYGNKENLFRTEYNRIIATFYYYLKKGKVTLSIIEEEEDPSLLGPKKFGKLIKILAYLMDFDAPFLYGEIRFFRTSSMIKKELITLKNYKNRIVENTKLTSTENIFFPGEEFSSAYQASIPIYFKNKNISVPTAIYKFLKNGPAIFRNMDPNHIKSTSGHIEKKLFPHLKKAISNTLPSSLSTAKKAVLLKEIARIQFYLTHQNIYLKGAEFFIEMINSALLKGIGLSLENTTERLATTELQAFLIPALDPFLTDYPQSLCGGNYHDAAEKLSIKTNTNRRKIDLYLKNQLGIKSDTINKNDIIKFLNDWIKTVFELQHKFKLHTTAGKNIIHNAIIEFISPVGAILCSDALNNFKIPHKTFTERRKTYLMIKDLSNPLMKKSIEVAKEKFESDQIKKNNHSPSHPKT